MARVCVDDVGFPFLGRLGDCVGLLVKVWCCGSCVAVEVGHGDGTCGLLVDETTNTCSMTQSR